MRCLSGVLLCLAALFMTAMGVSAHAELVSSTPADGATLDSAPAVVRLVFDDEINTQDVQLTVTAADGTRVDAGDGGVDLSDVSHKTLNVSLKDNVGPGTYTVTWQVTGDDGHAVSGSITFTVAAADQPTAVPITATPAVPAPTLPTTGGAASALLWLAALACVLMLAGTILRRSLHRH